MAHLRDKVALSSHLITVIFNTLIRAYQRHEHAFARFEGSASVNLWIFGKSRICNIDDLTVMVRCLEAMR